MKSQAPLFPRYQDYVIKDGKFVGKFEEMYRDHQDPWEQKKEIHATDKALALALVQHAGAKRVIEVGCVGSPIRSHTTGRS